MLSRWKGRFTSFISALVIPYLLTPLSLSGNFRLLLLTEPSIRTYYHTSLGFIVTPSSTVDVQAPPFIRQPTRSSPSLLLSLFDDPLSILSGDTVQTTAPHFSAAHC
ncbi:hypothetical protein EDB83DRAFT_2475333, partial [Lactarius deliciosus]